jgi:TolA-binding protein
MTKPISLADPEQIQHLYQQACEELDQLEPELRELELQITQWQQRYQTLKQNKQRLLTIKLSLHTMVSLGDEPLETGDSDAVKGTAAALTLPDNTVTASPAKVSQFSAEVAFHEVNQRLRQRDSVNYEIFRAIVYQGGRANTDQIKQYLIEQDIRQPATGTPFHEVTLADISARVNYLVKKGLVVIEQRGQFKSVFGWMT